MNSNHQFARTFLFRKSQNISARSSQSTKLDVFKLTIKKLVTLTPLTDRQQLPLEDPSLSKRELYD